MANATRLASSLIISRDSEDGPEIFLVKRNPRLKFMGGFWAFPGGTVMQEDYASDNNSLNIAHARCALRELFEETGILICNVGNGLSSAERLHIRGELLESDATENWLNILESASVEYDKFSPVCNITTPPFAPVKYNTQFFHVPLDADTVPDIVHGELVDCGFFKPVEAVDLWQQGEIRIAPPNLFLLKLMIGKTFSEFKKSAGIETGNFRQGSLHPVYLVPGIFMAPLRTPTLPPATTTNTLIVGNEKLYLVEPATPDLDEQQRLFAKMDELIGEGRKFEGILLTHHHVDHVGAVNAASLKYDLPVRAHPLTYDRIEQGFIKGEPLVDGARIELGNSPDGKPGWHLDILHTPGHAVDHLCYLESRYQSAIIGDMMSTVSTILIDPPEGHMRTYLESLERLLEYPIKTVFPSHGPVHIDGHALIRYFLNHRQERENRIIEALGAAVQTIDELLPRVYDDVEESSIQAASRSLLAGLIKLQEDGVCQSSDQGWKLLNQPAGVF